MFRSTSLLRALPKSLPIARTAIALPRSTNVLPARRAFALTAGRKMDPAKGDFNGYFGGEPAEEEVEHDEFRMPGRVFVQGPAPNFKATLVKEGEFSEAKLTDYRGKWVVLLFYPMDFTFVCPTEILSFDRALAKFKELNTEVIGVSTDSEYSHLAWSNLPRQEGGLGPNLTIPLLSDKNHEMSKDYGVLIPEMGISLRGLFIIDPTGTVRQITINDLPVGRSVEETIRLIKAFQFTDEHGEVCPADWSPENSDTIKADPKASKEYFGKQK